MSEQQQQSTPETYVDIKESYVDVKLREFFETEKNDVNIDNICLFSAMVVEDYNHLSEHKLKGKQKFEAATDLAKRIIEKTVAFVAEDQRRQVVKNIYYNIDAIPQTIEFICKISGNPNLVNANKWVLDKVNKAKEEVVAKKSLLSRIFSCSKADPTPVESTEVVEAETPSEVPVDKKKLKQEEKRRKAEEKLQKELEEIRMTPEEKEAKIKAAKEAKIQAKKDAEEQKKAAKEAKIQAKKDAEEQKRLEKLKQKERELQEALDKLKEEAQPASTTETPTNTEIVDQTTVPEVPVEVQEIEMSDMAVGA
jgi:type IV secretory pathway VirB10-like protein